MGINILWVRALQMRPADVEPPLGRLNRVKLGIRPACCLSVCVCTVHVCRAVELSSGGEWKTALGQAYTRSFDGRRSLLSSRPQTPPGRA